MATPAAIQSRPVKRPLTPWQVALYRLLFPVGLLMFLAGFAGKAEQVKA